MESGEVIERGTHEALRAHLARELHGELGSTLVAARLALAGVPSVTDAARGRDPVMISGLYARVHACASRQERHLRET